MSTSMSNRATLQIVRRHSGLTSTKIVAMVAMASISSIASLAPVQFLAAIASVASENSSIWSDWIKTPSANAKIAILITASGTLTILAAFIRNLFCTWASNATESGSARLRMTAYGAALSAPWWRVRSEGEYTLSDSISHDSDGVHSVFSQPMYTLLSDVFDMLVIVVFLAPYGGWPTVVLVASVPPMMVLARVISKRQYQLMREARSASLAADSLISNQLHMLEVVKSFRFEGRALDSYEKRVHLTRDLSMRANTELGVFFTLQAIAQAVATTGVIYLLSRGVSSAPEVAAVTLIGFQYCQRFFRPLTTIVAQIQDVARGLVSLKRVAHVISLEPEWGRLCASDSSQTPAPRRPVDLEMKDFQVFDSEGNRLVGVADARFEPGSVTAIVGPSGSGKSSLLRGILGLLPSDGHISVGGTVRESMESAERWRSHFCLAASEAWSAGTTVEEAAGLGCMLGQDETDAMIRALGLVGLGHLDPKAADASTLSAGELRRLSLVRTLVHPAPVVLFDEVDSNVDADTRRIIVSVVNAQLRGRKTIIWVTHNTDFGQLSPDEIMPLESKDGL